VSQQEKTMSEGKKRVNSGHKSHASCVACGPDNPAGLRLKFAKQPDGSVRAAVFCRREISGYDGFLHGGVAALMLDSAMTNCLFSLGVAALTAEFNLKYKAPVLIGRAAELRAWLVSDMAPLYLLKAELSQDGRVKVLAEAKFLKNTFLKD
jgi:acyl-coenzyme A thioesterase PaaI-like protein